MTPSLRYFGTDGVRGRALEGLLSRENATRWGAAWGKVASHHGIESLYIGWDPRLSSEALVQAFLAGWGSTARANLLGVVPTPAVAWLTAQAPRAWGLMVSASHNPPEDNGLKGFDHHGNKLPEAEEAAIESAFDQARPISCETPLTGLDAAPMEAYLAHLQASQVPQDFRLVVDCAHGAAAPWAPRLFGNSVCRWIGTPADGSRINVGVGSTHLEALQAEVLNQKATLGLAFDGDGDRCLMVGPDGTVLDGDQLLWLLALHRKRLGQSLPGVVGTVMTNGGLEAALKSQGIPLLRTPVGDKHMVRALQDRGWDLAAEASGHVIQKHYGPSGDALATALSALQALAALEEDSRWSWPFTPWPQRLVNLVASERRPVEACSHLQGAIKSLEETGHRLVIRWSGTEPKLRLMVEASTQAQVDAALEVLQHAARVDLGI